MLQLGELNERQIQAVTSGSKRLLAGAGAGSGKTKTLIQKILSLLGTGAKPSSILAITFTKNAANEIWDRLILAILPLQEMEKYDQFIHDKNISNERKNDERKWQIRRNVQLNNVAVKTFHSFCYKMLKDAGSPVFDNKFRLLSDEALQLNTQDANQAPEKKWDIIDKILIDCCKNRNYLLILKRYILDYVVVGVKHEKEQKYNVYPAQYITLKGDHVRSKSERDIADWLYRHNINYTYEPVVNFSDFSFKPDFYLPQGNIYIEHVSDKSYPLSGKEKQFKKAGKLMVKTHESIMQDSKLFNLTMEQIIRGRISDDILGGGELDYKTEFQRYYGEVNDFLKMVLRVFSMIKSENVSITDLREKALNSPHERIRLFYELALELYGLYLSYCINKSYLDFDDLIIKANELLEKHVEIREKYQNQLRYILVDEFQDVNSLQVQLLHNLLTDKMQLFCVGDDWQSIYGFRGSEVEYIVNFKNHFVGSELIKLETNYRSTEVIVNAGNEVIKNNKFKVEKYLKAIKSTPCKIKIYKAKEIEEDAVDYVANTIKQYLDSGVSGDNIMILYRRSAMYKPFKERLIQEGIKVSAKTIHAAKGLEAEIVFIIGLTEGYGGFPDIWLDDAVFRIIKDIKYDLLLEEERRLFYVAISRTREELHLITQLGNESSFLAEIPAHYYSAANIEYVDHIAPILLCNSCKTLIKSHFAFCPNCGMKL